MLQDNVAVWGGRGTVARPRGVGRRSGAAGVEKLYENGHSCEDPNIRHRHHHHDHHCIAALISKDKFPTCHTRQNARHVLKSFGTKKGGGEVDAQSRCA